MLTHPTLDQMGALGLAGMADAWKALAEQDPGQALDRNEWLGLMLDREASARADKRFANRLRNARMRFPNACIEDINFRSRARWPYHRTAGPAGLIAAQNSYKMPRKVFHWGNVG